jgi:hypothetical protein
MTTRPHVPGHRPSPRHPWTSGEKRALPLAVLLLGTALALGACGKKAPPQPPGPSDQVTWPHAYPTPPTAQAPKP